MATTKKGTTVKTPAFVSWWKHLRPLGKRGFWKKQRASDKKQIRKDNDRP